MVLQIRRPLFYDFIDLLGKIKKDVEGDPADCGFFTPADRDFRSGRNYRKIYFAKCDRFFHVLYHSGAEKENSVRKEENDISAWYNIIAYGTWQSRPAGGRLFQI